VAYCEPCVRLVGGSRRIPTAASGALGAKKRSFRKKAPVARGQRASESVVEAGAAFVRPGPVGRERQLRSKHIRIIKAVVQGTCEIKASGGIQNLETINAMLSLGVTRFGINTRVALELLKECALAEPC
jgi:deoxyribose-phosphate aldolase